ncbi:hypothetical protein NEF87_003798 [Candidatus Lokiarchaeum ossiferum]|uniref:Peptidase M3A/M3B catalytic domain-containing protein n=1 Tax=Candidatus Lokiarchaeum ossiferum TaxID=2951803 RepID=A0ABY6HVG3_9ARCH|nr:hypothetical protein NEF87_003798 [Candidatus Lokiarchaeum sp. B-35]
MESFLPKESQNSYLCSDCSSKLKTDPIGWLNHMQEFSLDMLSYNFLELLGEYQKILLDHKRFGKFDLQKAKYMITRYEHIFSAHTLDFLNDYIKSSEISELEKFKWSLTRDLVLEYKAQFLLFEDVFNIQYKKHMMSVPLEGKQSVPVSKALSMIFDQNNPDSHVIMQSYIREMDKLNPIYLKIINKYQSQAQLYGYASFLDLMKDNHQMDLDRIYSKTREFLKSSFTTYQEKLTSLSKPYLGKTWNEVSYADMWKLFSGFWLPHQPITGEKMVSFFNKTCNHLGYQFEGNSLIEIDLDSRSGKLGNSYCGFPLGEKNKKIVLVVYPYFHHNDLSTFHHESGHAIHLSNISPSLSPLFRAIGDFAVAETPAYLFQKLLHKPSYIEDILSYSYEHAQKFAQYYSFIHLYKQRKLCSQFIFLYNIFQNSWQLTPTQFEKIFYDAEQQYKLDFGFERKCYDFVHMVEEKPFIAAHYLRAENASSIIESRLTSKFGLKWWNSENAGKFLQERYFSHGFGKSLEFLLQNFMK